MQALEGAFDPLGARTLGNDPPLHLWLGRLFILNAAYGEIGRRIETERKSLRKMAIPFDFTTDSRMQESEALLEAARLDLEHELSRLAWLYNASEKS